MFLAAAVNCNRNTQTERKRHALGQWHCYELRSPFRYLG
jgi:hypothetical protein